MYTCDLAKVPENRRGFVALCLFQNGWVQKMGDAGAGKEDTEAHENRTRIVGNLESGVWAEAGGARLDPVFAEIREIMVARKLVKADRVAKDCKDESATRDHLTAIFTRAGKTAEDAAAWYDAAAKTAAAIVAARTGKALPEVEL